MSTAAYKVSFDEVKRAVSMEQVIGFLGLTGLRQRSASQWKGDCPFCRGAGCFVVTNDGGREKTGAFNCFKCPAGGDQIELVSMVRGNPRKHAQGVFAAAKELHEKFIGGADADKVSNHSNTSPQPQQKGRQGFDAEAYAKGLDPAHEALAVLGIDPETFREWKAGYASTGVHRGRLALPVIGRDGVILGFAGLALNVEDPALTFPNGIDPRDHIFGADRVSAGPLTLVRNPLAVLRACESGCENVVCLLTDEITGSQLESLAALMTERQCRTLTFF